VTPLPGSRSLRVQVLAPTAVLFAITLFLGGIFAADRYGRDVVELQLEGVEHFVGRVNNALTSLMLEHGDLNATLQSMVAMRRDVEVINVMRPDGQIAFSSEPALVHTTPWPDLSPFEQGAIARPSQGDAYAFAFVQPIRNAPACGSCHGRDPARIDGWLDVRFSNRVPVEAARELKQTLLFSSSLAFACLIGISWVLLTFVVLRPLERLLGVMQRVRTGELGVRTRELAPNELGQVARSFDETLETLEAARGELEAFARERLIQADRFAAVGEMATSLTHEIKNPLAGLSGAMEVLTRDLEAMPRERDLVIEMRRQVMRLARVVEGLLGFARAPRPQMRSTSLHAALERVLFLVRHQQRATIQVEANLADALPQVWADPAQIEQVLLNLCLNAIQAMGPQGGTLRATTFTELGHVIVEIADSGPGIPADVRPHIFEAFFTTKPGGSGLGLATSARIVAEHGGHIDYRCPEGGGTVFRITLHPSPRPVPEDPRGTPTPGPASSRSDVTRGPP
jgi:signal transduction histidine kinase